MTRVLAIMIAAALVGGGCGGKKPGLGARMKNALFPPPASTLVARVAGDHADERREALQALAADKKARTVPSVVKIFCAVARNPKEEPLVRAAAVRGLGLMEGQGVLETLSQVAVDDSNHYVRADAAVALGCQGKTEGLGALVEALNADPSADVRLEAAEALRHFKDAAAAEALAAALADRDIAVARKAWESLRYMTGQDLPRRSQAWIEFLASAEDPFAAYGRSPRLPKGESKRPHFTKGIGEFVEGLFRKDPLEVELE